VWDPEQLAAIDGPEWQQLYVNAEHDGQVGVITLSRESYNTDVDEELNRAIDWLKQGGIERVVLTGDFHLATQLVGADIGEFFPALDDAARGEAISRAWSRTARRFHTDFRTSVALLTGKRCLGGMLELAAHCHYVVATDGTQLGFPEVTLPVIPGMEGCHWPLRKARPDDRAKLLHMLLGGTPVTAETAVGWLVDHAGPLPEALARAWELASAKGADGSRRALDADPLDPSTLEPPPLDPPGSPERDDARQAILACVRDACGVSLDEALEVQTRHSGAFMTTATCRRGRVGSEAARRRT
jgi:enoyl-CoA hydratase/carnithine racemase